MSSADRVLVRDGRRALPPGWVARPEYLAAQLVVLPAALIWLRRRSRPVYVFDVVAGLCAVAVGFVVCKVAPTRAR
jgi:hypothetical protein